MIGDKSRDALLRRSTTQNQKDLVAQLLKSRKRVEDAIVKAARDKRFGTSANIRDGVYVNLKDQYVKNQGDLDTWTKRSIENTGKDSYLLVNKDLAEVGGKTAAFVKFKEDHFKEYFERVHPLNAKRMAATNVEMNTKLNSMLGMDIRQMQNATVDVFRQARVEGMTAVERYKLLRGKLLSIADDPESWKFIASNGAKWQPNNYFMMLNRTVSANVARETYNDGLTEEGHDLVKIGGGGLSTNSAEACIAYLGKVVSLTGKTPGFPTLQDYIDAGGFHVNCVHYTIAVFQESKRGAKLIEEQKGEPKPEVKQPEKRAKTSSKKAYSPPAGVKKVEA